MRKYWAYWFTLTLTTTVSLLALSACTFKKPAEEIPVEAATREIGLPQSGIPKSFFVDPTGKPKTFLCGAASVGELTDVAADSVAHNMPLWDHCNMQFEITETQLLGKIVSPSFPDDPSRWRIGLMIPIREHYYYEKEKDANGRETNKYIENSGRSHWTARPFIKLDMTGMKILDPSKKLGINDASAVAIEDIEWDLEKGYLGYTITNVEGSSWWSFQNKTRINFLRFDHNENFIKTPFNDQNYKYMNVLHITGEKVSGVWPILYAAKWDLSKQHEIYLVGFPQEFVPIAEDIVTEWNQTLENIGAVKKGFNVFVIKKDKELKYGFDLRYSTITWIADQKISRAGASPLGVAMVTADVKNGEVLWGGVTLWGGIISEYINSYVSNDLSSSKPALKNLASFFAKNAAQENLSLPQQIAAVSTLNKFVMEKDQDALASERAKNLKDAVEKSIRKGKLPKDVDGNSYSALSANELRALSKDLDVVTQARSQITEPYQQNLSSGSYLQKFLKQARLGQPTQMSNDERTAAFKGSQSQNIDDAEMMAHSFIQCTELRLSDMAVGWRQGLSESKRDRKDLLRSTVKELISHEYGHFLGLGHQFKENILPQKGSVPDSIYNDLKAKAEKDQTNMTSVMGYRNPRIELRTEYKDIVPGPQDKLVLRFLYNQEFSTYKTGDPDFTFVKLPTSGLIPKNLTDNPEYKVSYFPQCNDIDATISRDPFCNRFDRGYDANSIVDGYVYDIKENLVQSLIAFSDSRGGDPYQRENYMWEKYLSVMGRLRVFYDYMRVAYSDQIEKIRTDERALYGFSEACASNSVETIEHPLLKQIFTENPGLKDLCQANGRVLNEIEKLVSLKASDYTKIDTLSAVIPGGMSAGDAQRDWSRFYGTWNEMSAMPIKISSLYALSTNTPWFIGWWGLANIPQYDQPNYRFSYSSLYPIEFTKIISSTATKNMFFSKSSIGQSDLTTMGSALYSLAYFNWMSQNNNDRNRFPNKFVQNLRSQTQFNLSFAALIVEFDTDGVMKKGRLKGTMYDMYTNAQVPLSEIFILPDGQVIADGENMFIFPLPWSQLRWISETKAYLFAYKVDYNEGLEDPLAGFSIKRELEKTNIRLLDTCINGFGITEESRNGLISFFNKSNDQFDGYRVEKGIQTDEDKQRKFLVSVRQNFAKYWNQKKDDKNWINPDPKTCTEALDGLGLVVSSSAILGGMWVPEVDKYLER
jgi:hypothetical protein